ncbi:MAG: hypothetical protein HY820_15645 [Acidobacteria bacterium]|nr:hypothetical protein [Acidobacteriota bacterium]
MLKLTLTLAFAVNAFAQPSVKDFGALGDGIHDDSAAFALALRSLDGLGGALRVPKGIYNLGTAGVVFPKTFGGIRMIGDSATATRLVYRGTGAAIRIGASDGLTYGHTISDLRVDLTDAGPKAIGIEIHAALYIALHRIYLTSNNTFPAALNHQVGIAAIGGDSTTKRFGAYLRIEDPRINGRFRKGIYLTAPEIGWGFNSCILEGGAIVYPGSIQEGTIGIHIEQGNQNVITLVDVEQYAVGIRSDAYANMFMGSRTEGNGVGMVLAPATGGVTGGAYNRVLSGFHWDGLLNQSHGSQIIATEYPQDLGSVPLTVAKPARVQQ